MSNPEAKPMLTKDEREILFRDKGAYFECEAAIAPQDVAGALRMLLASHDAADARIAEQAARLAEADQQLGKLLAMLVVYEAMRELLAEAKLALEPFASDAAENRRLKDEDYPGFARHKVGDLRRAARAYGKLGV